MQLLRSRLRTEGPPKTLAAILLPRLLCESSSFCFSWQPLYPWGLGGSLQRCSENWLLNRQSLGSSSPPSCPLPRVSSHSSLFPVSSSPPARASYLYKLMVGSFGLQFTHRLHAPASRLGPHTQLSSQYQGFNP